MATEADGATRGLARIAEAAARSEGQAFALLETLVEAAGVGSRAVETLVKDCLLRLECDVEVIAYRPREVPLLREFATVLASATDEERCIVGRMAGDRDGRSLLVFAHPDVEPFRADPPWQTDPFRLAARGGRLHGWGVADDLAGIVMLLQSAAVLGEAGLRPDGEVAFVCAPSKAHRRGIAAALHRGLTADAAVYLHPAESGRGLDEIKAFTPGQLEFVITVAGRPPSTNEPAHTGLAHRGVNAFAKTTVIAEALRQLDARRGESLRHPTIDRAVGRSTNLMLSFCGFGDETALARIPGECRLGGALSLLPGESLEDVMKIVEATIRAVAADDPWLSATPPEIDWVSGVSGAETSAEAPIYRTVDAVLRQLGATPTVNPLHTSSDIRNPIVQKGIPTVGFGPLCGGLTMCGHADEWVDGGDMVRAIHATAGIIAAWCGVR